MTEGRTIPIAGIVLALATGGVLVAAGESPWLASAAVAVWIVSFWLVAPQPVAPMSTQQPEGMQLTRSGMRDLIEHSGLPVLMLDGSRIIVANAAAREAIGTHIIGQDARVAFRHPAAVDLLSRHGGGAATIQGLTTPRSSWHMTRQPIDDRYCLIELVDRTAEADVSRAHTDFVANASHELRTPLASIIGYMETLIEEGEAIEPKRASRFHAIVLREARRLQSLVDDLMSLSRVEAEKHDQPREHVDLSLLIPQASRDGAGAERQERLEFAVPDDRLLARGDHKQLEQLVRNLVDNALKYAAPGTRVTIGLSYDDRHMAVITVRDRGDGIAPEHIPHLTRRFYRTDPGRSRAAGGTGLGLAIVKHIVDRHRGRLDIASQQGEGTTVTVRIPMVPEEAAAMS
ncbi:MAG: two-component sensor histidine kinase [Sphingomonadales bacterium 12-68-11]|nr:MAG: two-component sensor histidine kinase [Sphingomonadales bacterium 12-68-11]